MDEYRVDGLCGWEWPLVFVEPLVGLEDPLDLATPLPLDKEDSSMGGLSPKLRLKESPGFLRSWM